MTDETTTYALTLEQATDLAASSVMPPDLRREILAQHAARHGTEALVALFAEFIGLANSVVENNGRAAEDIMVDHGFSREDARRLNLPTILGALEGVRLAALAEGGRPCGACAFRPGTAANQSVSTIADARRCLDGRWGDFFCHENMKADGEPARVCRGFAAAKRARRGAGG